jgi:hypothetical protein
LNLIYSRDIFTEQIDFAVRHLTTVSKNAMSLYLLFKVAEAFHLVTTATLNYQLKTSYLYQYLSLQLSNSCGKSFYLFKAQQVGGDSQTAEIR